MRKLIAAACLALVLLAILLTGCDSTFQKEATYEGINTAGWVELVKDDDVEWRRRAAVVLGELGLTEADETVPALAGACSDPDTHVKLMALKSLEKLAPKGKKAQGAVSRAINDKNKLVMKQAIKTYKAIEMAKPSALNGH
jgi:hypothetical protein